jgi:hypothetical protein
MVAETGKKHKTKGRKDTKKRKKKKRNTKRRQPKMTATARSERGTAYEDTSSSAILNKNKTS